MQKKTINQYLNYIPLYKVHSMVWSIQFEVSLPEIKLVQHLARNKYNKMRFYQKKTKKRFNKNNKNLEMKTNAKRSILNNRSKSKTRNNVFRKIVATIPILTKKLNSSVCVCVCALFVFNGKIQKFLVYMEIGNISIFKVQLLNIGMNKSYYNITAL